MKIIPLAFRFGALVVAIVQILLVTPAGYYRLNPYLLFAVACVDGLAISVLPLILPPRNAFIPPLAKIMIDIVICVSLVVFSGALSSPFILYSLAPVLSASLVLNSKIASVVAIATGCAVIISHVANPFYTFQISAFSISQLTIYVAAICFAVFLPYLVNIKKKQLLEDARTLQERRRLSREIHDGVAQTLNALCWQAEKVCRSRAFINFENKELEKLEKLALKARRDILDTLDALRNNTDESKIQTILTDCLENFRQDSGIALSSDVENGDIYLDGEVRKELVFICQEALSNIKKHSGAHAVKVNMRQANGHLELSIIDDGRGFDAISYRGDSNGHHGLAVMQERAQLINGKFSVSSTPGQGTIVKVEVPFNSRRGQQARS